MFNLMMGFAGIFLAGDSMGKSLERKSVTLLIIGLAELAAGVYFMVAAIGNLN